MGLFIFGIILLLFALGLWFGRRFWPPRRSENETRSAYALHSARFWRFGFTGGAILLLACALIALFFSTFRRVNTKEIGVPVTFGSVGTTHYGAGPHWPVAPWTKVVEIDGAIQTLDHLDKRCFQVRIANNQTGCAEVSIQWRVNPAQVDYLYKNYRSFKHIESQLVDRKLFNATNEALAAYNPLAAIASGKGARNPLPGYATKIYNGMKTKVTDINGKPLIEVLNVQLPIVHFDDKTQDRINQLQQQVAQTQIANQREKTNAAESKANAALAKTKGGLSELVLVSRCIDWLDAEQKAGQAVPAGFSCWPGGSSNFGGVVATTNR
jgi:regulator of protease activity HflC (stomatin/prohibitin superfamily)